MSQLGFTFYPKDWWTSDTFFEFSLTQRYIYLECLFLMYSNGGSMRSDKLFFERRMLATISNDDWDKVVSKFEIVDGLLTNASVNSRLRKTLANRENGEKGGRPPGDKIIYTKTGKPVPSIIDGGHFIYLIFDSHTVQYKIGETKNLKNRRQTIKRPSKHLSIIDFGIHDPFTCQELEKHIKYKYKEKIISGDWFYLNEKEVSEIISLINNGVINPKNPSNNPPLEREREIESKIEIENKVNNKEQPALTFSSTQFGKKPIKKLKESCAGYSEWLNTIAKKNSLLVHDVLEWLDAFELHILGSGKMEETEQEFKRYFNSWITSEIRQGRKPKVENQSKDAPQKTHEQIAQEVIIKKYGNRAY